jgi:stress-induced morphogen
MATIVRGAHDRYVRRIKNVLDQYEQANPGAVADVFRRDTACVWVRIVDARFKRMKRGDRHDTVYDFLVEHLEDDTLQEISVLLPLAPEELSSSVMNAEFDDPVPSRF